MGNIIIFNPLKMMIVLKKQKKRTMKQFSRFVTLFSFLFVFSSTMFAQKFDWQGRWEFKSTEESFCNIHIVTNLTQGQSEPTAIVEGLSYGKPFRIKARIEDLKQRNSLVFYELADANGATQYNANEPLLILTAPSENSEPTDITPVWVQVDITKHSNHKHCLVTKVPIPRYRGVYSLEDGDNKMSLAISKMKKAKFSVKLETGNTGLFCDCSLETTHLAVCYPSSDKGAFYLDFNADGVKLIKSYEDNIYNTKLMKTEDGGPLVLHTTLKK